MSRYIDADKLAQAFATERSLIDEKCKGDELKYLFRKYACNFALFMISVADKEDVTPVVHAHWIDDGYYADFHPHKVYRCSNCDWSKLDVELPEEKYCPNCGAKMDEVI